VGRVNERSASGETCLPYPSVNSLSLLTERYAAQQDTVFDWSSLSEVLCSCQVVQQSYCSPMQGVKFRMRLSWLHNNI